MTKTENEILFGDQQSLFLEATENRVIDFIKRHPVLMFFALTFTYTWTLWGLLFIIAPEGFVSGRIQGFQDAIIAIMAFLGGTGSSVMGIMLTRIIEKKKGVRNLFTRRGIWRKNENWYFVAILTIPFILMVLLMVLAISISQTFLPGIFVSEDITSLIAFGIILGIVAGCVEEFGWTGFALPRLQKKHSPLASALIIGPIWGLWHFLGDYWGRRVAFGELVFLNFAVFAVLVIAYRILMTWVYNNTNGNLSLAIFMHASFSGSLYIFMPAFTSVVDHIIAHLVLSVILWILVLIVVLFYGKNLKKDS